MMSWFCKDGRSALAAGLLGCALLLAACGDDGDGNGSGDAPASTLLDLSGLAWLDGDRFVGVHDAKNPDELDRPRVSILTLPVGQNGITYRTVDLDWPDLFGPSSDLESVARIPGSDDLLFAESGDDGDPDFRRIFLVRWDGEGLALVDFTFWPVDVFNVEAIAVGSIEGETIFAFAERAEGLPATEIRWARFDPATLEFGEFSSATFANPDPGRANRPVVGMDIDADGNTYIVSAYDPDEDDGPFLSAVYRAGRFVRVGGDVLLELLPKPEVMAQVDGFKTESVAVRPGDGAVGLFIGTDDENLGNVLRPLP